MAGNTINCLGRNGTTTVGLLGGSFNPAHAGHRHISIAALKGLRLNLLWWLVTPQNPLKPSAGLMPLEQRMAMARRIAAHPRINVLDIEKELPSPYTLYSLRYIKRRFPNIHFVWIMGADNLEQFPKWHKWQEIVKLMPIAIYDRGDYAYKGLAGIVATRYRQYRVAGRNIHTLANRKPPAWGYIRMIKHPLSSTIIRNTIR